MFEFSEEGGPKPRPPPPPSDPRMTQKHIIVNCWNIRTNSAFKTSIENVPINSVLYLNVTENNCLSFRFNLSRPGMWIEPSDNQNFLHYCGLFLGCQLLCVSRECKLLSYKNNQYKLQQSLKRNCCIFLEACLIIISNYFLLQSNNSV